MRFVYKGYSKNEVFTKFKNALSLRVAKMLPKSVAYWSFINLGVKNIKNNEIVPEVTYTTILQRVAK